MIETDLNFVVAVPAQEISTPDTRRQELRALRTTYERTYLDIGRLLWVTFDLNDWRSLGYVSFGSYATDVLGISGSEASDLLHIATLRELHPQIEPLLIEAGKAKVRAILPEITDDGDMGDVMQWLETASKNSWRDLLALRRDGEMHPPTAHDVTCPNCGTTFTP